MTSAYVAIERSSGKIRYQGNHVGVALGLDQDPEIDVYSVSKTDSGTLNLTQFRIATEEFKIPRKVLDALLEEIDKPEDRHLETKHLSPDTIIPEQ